MFFTHLAHASQCSECFSWILLFSPHVIYEVYIPFTSHFTAEQYDS